MKTLLPILKTKFFLLSFVSACTVILATTVPQIRNFIAPQAKEEKIIEDKTITPEKKHSKKFRAERREALTLSSEETSVATVETDLPDYSPGKTVNIFGYGWYPGETVTIKIVSDCGCINMTYYAIAGADSTISNSEFITDATHLGVTFFVTATGQTSLQVAQTTFHDAVTIWENTIQTNAPDNFNPYTIGDAFSSFITVSGIGRGTGINPQNANDRYNADGWNTLAIDLNAYFNFTLTPNSGYHIKFNDFAYVGQVQTNGPSSFAFRSNANGDNYATNIGTPTATGATIPLTASQFQNVTTAVQFRLYGWNATNANASFSVNSFTFGGAILGTSTIATPLTNFTTCINTPSTAQSFTVNGVGLLPTNATVTIAGSTNYEVSTTSAVSGFGGSASLTATPPNGTVTGTVWVRLKANATPGIYNGETINVSGGGFAVGDNINVTVNGSVLGTVATITGEDGPVCPSSSNDYSAPSANSYLWQIISGTATIAVGEQDDQTATVTAGSACDDSYTLKLTITDANGCTSTSSSSITVAAPAALVIDAPANYTASSCDYTSQADVNGGFASWLAGFKILSGGCDPQGSYGSPVAPPLCGGTVRVTYVASDACESVTATASYTVTAAAAIVIDAPANYTASSCDYTSQADVNGGFASWLAGFKILSGGCNPQGSYGSPVAPPLCGGTVRVTYVASDACESVTATASYTVTAAAAIVIDAPANYTASSCDYTSQADVNGGFASWLAGFKILSGGCDPQGSYGSPVAPPLCGGTVRVTYVASDACESVTATASYTVTAAAALVIDAPANYTASSCDYTSQADVNGGFASWLAGFKILSGGCNPQGSYGSPVAPPLCGGTVRVTYVASDACESVTATASYTVTEKPAPTIGTPAAGQTVNCGPTNAAALTAWLSSNGGASATDACGGGVTWSNNFTNLSNDCGATGSATVIFTATDDCGKTSTTSATFTIVDTAPATLSLTTAPPLAACNPSTADVDASLGTATATDACGNPTVSFTDNAVQSSNCLRSQTRTFTAIDGCGNISTVSRTVNWTYDVTPPDFTGSYADVNLGCNPANPDGSLGTATATDVCGAVTITSSDGGVVTDGCNRSITRTFTATDGCLNTSTASRTVGWIADLTPADFTGSYADVNLGCNPANPSGSLGTATATDVCGAVTITSSDGGVVTDGCNRSITRTFTATDGCLNTSTASRTVRWIADLTPADFTGSYADVNLGCNPANPDGSLGTATATDVCGAVTITSSDAAVVSDGCNRSRTRTFTATDGCLNTSTTSRTVRWIYDVTPADFTGSYADVNLGCNPANPDGSLGTATATDVCGAVTITSNDGAVVSEGCNRSRTRTFTAADGCLNTSTTSRTVRWIYDVTPADFTGSYADVNLGCNPANPDGSLGTATATDVCGAVTITSNDGAVVSEGCNRSRTRTFTATDGCLNTSTTSRTVRWIYDVTPADFTGSYADVNLGCNPANPDGSLGTATATDVCGAVTITSSDGAVVSEGCNRSRTRTFTATDGCLNTSTTSRTVRWIYDVTPADFTGSYADVNLGCNPANPDGSLGTATATDICGAVTITSSDAAVVSNGCNRSRTRTFTATDGCLNTSTTSRTVRWIADVTPPTFTGDNYADVNLGCNPANPDGSLGTATATDVCGAVTITSSDAAVVSAGCNRSRTRTFTATDGCLNTSTASRTVRWIADVTPPTFTGDNYADVNLGCNPANPDGSLGTATATDVCGAVTITSSDAAVVSAGCNRSRTRTFTATDGCLNTSTASRTVRWIADVTPAAFTGSYADVNLGCNPANPDGSLGTATATDVCGAVTITSSDAAVVSNGCNRSRTRTFTATDGCLNTSTTSRTVRWIYDVTPPDFTGDYADVNLGCNPANPDGSLGTATATDVCGAVTITSSDGAVVSDGCNRSRTRTVTATDGCLNTSTTSRTVRWVVDGTPPIFTGSYTNVGLDCNPSSSAITAALGTATATDVCSTPTITVTDGTVSSTSCLRSQTRTFIATDACGNTSTVSRTVTWIHDITGPSIPGTFVNKTVLWPPNHKMVDVALSPATDLCGGVVGGYLKVTSNEPKNGIGDGNTEPDMEWNGSAETDDDPYTVEGPVVLGTDGKYHILLRAERSGVNAVAPDEGRIYTIYFTATDACGNSSTASKTVTVAHNITNPGPGNAYPINTTVSLAGTFWDVPGKTHTAKWVVDASTVNGTVTLEPNGRKMGKVTGSFKPTVAGVYKLRMNVTDQTGLTSYATTSGDYEAYFVAYDPRGGYTYGAGQYISPAGALTAQPNLTDVVTFGFASNYYKNATNPKGETQIEFKLTDGEYSFGFNALNYDYLVVNGSKAMYKGLGKTITNGVEQSGLAFIMTVIDGKNENTPNGVDKIRMKIYNKNTGAVIYDNQMGDPETDDPTTEVGSPNEDGSDIVVVSTPETSADITAHNAQMEVAPDLTKFNVRAFPNPSEHVFSLVLENATNEKVQIVVYDALGRQVKMFEKQSGNIPIHFGMDLKVGVYIVEVRQGDNRKTLKLVKQ